MIKTIKQATKEARRRWGNKARVRDNGWKRAATAEERAAAKAELISLNEQIKALQARRDEVRIRVYSYQYDVGKIINAAAGFAFFEIKGSADSWDDAFAKADAKTIEKHEHP